ncbi:hypothetical protein HHL24_26995 [Paraburkholderia sp. RP-4-7]|jgi:hypothetical protein|uniref:Uncharacterized protein n=1 Tax=Paraburkholderia polaris TaxID=2728848 RepID=A0A848IH79_9BURK|nr:hypothetical protein [Paraburkholderia polaris]NMM01572.1 hypothetical protein [Paraburkholderia polaris]
MTKIYKANESFCVWHGAGNCDNTTSDLREALHIQADLIADGHEPVYILDQNDIVVDGPYRKRLRINVQQLTALLSSPGDEDLVGLYSVEFSQYLRDRKSLRQEKLAEAALNIFRARHGIEHGERFNIEVVDPFGRVIEADADFTDFCEGAVEKMAEPLTFFVDDAIKPGSALETVQRVASVQMQDVVGDYDVPATVPEWSWVEEHASYKHLKNGERGTWEFVLNLSCEYTGDMGRLAPVINEALSLGVSYLIIHQGT